MTSQCVQWKCTISLVVFNFNVTGEGKIRWPKLAISFVVSDVDPEPRFIISFSSHGLNNNARNRDPIIFNSTVGGSSVYNYENNSELGGSEQGLLSGNEEFETGSENDRPLDGNPDKGIELGGENNGGVSERYKIYVANKDDDDLDSLENSMANEEESGGVDVPVAQVSMDDEVLFSQLSTKTFSLEVESK
ncbi:hypothetical protein ES332_A12G238700v1 [Gossypium tomentosum]|uniref:Uncharacterized protein n=1 Tax=Gossypium tomentosum TaxID=34277 RepID=A0A5D2N1G8_GOSTO|nr:hypothetical protein ES332_A12G238700v1 [Gossypium tomentosum]